MWSPNNRRAVTNNEFQRNVCLFYSVFFFLQLVWEIRQFRYKSRFVKNIFQQEQRFLSSAPQAKALHVQHNKTEYFYVVWDSKYLSQYVSSSMDTELGIVLFNHCTFRRFNPGNSLSVFYECLTWSLMQGGNNRNKISRKICWEKSGPQRVEIRCVGRYV